MFTRGAFVRRFVSLQQNNIKQPWRWNFTPRSSQNVPHVDHLLGGDLGEQEGQVLRHRVWFVSCWEQPVGLQTPVLVVLLDLQHLVLRNSKVSGAAALLKNEKSTASCCIACCSVLSPQMIFQNESELDQKREMQKINTCSTSGYLRTLEPEANKKSLESWLAATPAALGSPSCGSKFFKAAISWSWAYFFFNSCQLSQNAFPHPKSVETKAFSAMMMIMTVMETIMILYYY